MAARRHGQGRLPLAAEITRHRFLNRINLQMASCTASSTYAASWPAGSSRARYAGHRSNPVVIWSPGLYGTNGGATTVLASYLCWLLVEARAGGSCLMAEAARGCTVPMLSGCDELFGAKLRASPTILRERASASWKRLQHARMRPHFGARHSKTT